MRRSARGRLPRFEPGTLLECLMPCWDTFEGGAHGSATSHFGPLDSCSDAAYEAAVAEAPSSRMPSHVDRTVACHWCTQPCLTFSAAELWQHMTN